MVAGTAAPLLPPAVGHLVEVATSGSNPATRLARSVLGEFVRHGVREVVLAPGSRSAPLAFESLRLARVGAIRLHVRVDERSAGFLALGLAKTSGAPVAVVSTSGTAVANLAPAVVEASYSAVPLVVVTADRPVESRGVGSPQTIDQVEFFGGAVRFFADLGGTRDEQDHTPQEVLHTARSAARRAIGAATASRRSGAPEVGAVAVETSHAGPVHLNLGLRLPLVPGAPGPEAGLDHAVAMADDVWRPEHGSPDPWWPGEADVPLPARAVVVAGDLPCTGGLQQQLIELSAACGWPIVGEPSSGLHTAPTALGHGVLVLGNSAFLAEHRPDLVLTIGNFGLSRPTLDLVGGAVRHVAIELPSLGREVCDPLRSADAVITAIPEPPTRAVHDPAWGAAWRHADQVAAAVVSDLVVASDPAGSAGSDPLTGSAAAARLWRTAASDAMLLVAASWPVRQVEAFGGRRDPLVVVGNRGGNGIDGLVSTAWGAALAHQMGDGGPALALLGDLAFLHDHNGLLVGAEEPHPDLVIVVLDNNGGGIFHQLEQGRTEYAESFERVFATPLGRDLVAIAQAAGVPARRAVNGLELDAAIEAAQAAGGVQVVVVDVPDRAGEATLLVEVGREVARRWVADRG